MKLFQRLLMEEQGQGVTEYALMIGLVVFGMWLAITQTSIGPSIRNLFNQVGAEIASCPAGGANCSTGGGT